MTAWKVTDVRRLPLDEGDRPAVYIWPVGETVLDNLMGRYFRPADDWSPLVPQILKETGLDPKQYTWAWSQLTGCACGCSPGFRVGPVSWDGPIPDFELHVNITSDPDEGEG